MQTQKTLESLRLGSRPRALRVSDSPLGEPLGTRVLPGPDASPRSPGVWGSHSPLCLALSLGAGRVGVPSGASSPPTSWGTLVLRKPVARCHAGAPQEGAVTPRPVCSWLALDPGSALSSGVASCGGAAGWSTHRHPPLWVGDWPTAGPPCPGDSLLGPWALQPVALLTCGGRGLGSAAGGLRDPLAGTPLAGTCPLLLGAQLDCARGLEPAPHLMSPVSRLGPQRGTPFSVPSPCPAPSPEGRPEGKRPASRAGSQGG